MNIDLSSSAGVDINMIRAIQSLPYKLKSQLEIYREAPESQKSYFVEKYVNGTICAVN